MLNLTPMGLVSQLRSEVDGVDSVDEWGWTCLHKAAVYGKADHVLALLDAGASFGLRTVHGDWRSPFVCCRRAFLISPAISSTVAFADPTQMYKAKATALELADLVQSNGWGERSSVTSLLQTAEVGEWKTARADGERRKLKLQEEQRVAEERLSRDLEMVERGGALKQLQLRDEMIANAAAMDRASERQHAAAGKQRLAEAAQAAAEAAQALAEQRQAAAEATLEAVEAALRASRGESVRLAAEIARLAGALKIAGDPHPLVMSCILE